MENPTAQPSVYSVSVLLALGHITSGRHVYAGTVPHAVKLRRRAKNRVARASRRTNRGR